MNKELKLKTFYCKNRCSSCGEEACETIFVLSNNKKIKLKYCEDDEETINYFLTNLK